MPTRENKRFDKRIVSFPRMGNVHIPVCSVLGGMGAEIILPPANNKETLSLGTRYSPETMCLPYKMNLGNYIQAIEKGANTLLMFGAPGSCRLGTYAIQAEAKLKELGYDFEMVVFDLYKGGVVELIEKFSRATDSKNILGGIRGLKLGLSKFAALDEVEKGLLYWRPREKDAGNAERIYLKGVRLIDKAASHDEVRNAVSQTLDEYRGIPVNKNREILKIFLTGEFYVLLEPFANMGIEKMLGNLGVEVQRQIMLSEWVSQAITPKWLRTWKTRKEKSKKYANRYFTRAVGGDCLESLGDVVNAAEKNVDGVIHLGPFNCTPEIISQSVIPHISRQEDIPVISLSMDEHTGRAGVLTRIEAFVDLIRRYGYKKDSKKELCAL